MNTEAMTSIAATHAPTTPPTTTSPTTFNATSTANPSPEDDDRPAGETPGMPGRLRQGRVAGKVALITGGASGLGEAISVLLAAEGASVIIADIDAVQGPNVAAGIRAAGGDATYLPLDVTQEVAWQKTMEVVLARHAQLHILVNNAGIAPPGSMTMSFALWRKVLGINLDGTFLGTKYAIQAMRDTGANGSIINISSVMAMVGQPTTAAYSASKGGVRSLTKAAAIYCAAEKLPIRVNSVHPGTCRTPLVNSHYAAQPDAALREQIARHPIGHLGEPEDIAYGVLYLASDESRFVMGAELVIDGGLLASD